MAPELDLTLHFVSRAGVVSFSVTRSTVVVKMIEQLRGGLVLAVAVVQLSAFTQSLQIVLSGMRPKENFINYPRVYTLCLPFWGLTICQSRSRLRCSFCAGVISSSFSRPLLCVEVRLVPPVRPRVPAV